MTEGGRAFQVAGAVQLKNRLPMSVSLNVSVAHRETERLMHLGFWLAKGLGTTGVSWALLVYMQNCQPTLLVFNRS